MAINNDERTIDTKKTGNTADIHPEAIYALENFPSKEQADALFRIGEYVADHGIEGDGSYLAARTLLLRQSGI